jgi:hypothetical protein
MVTWQSPAMRSAIGALIVSVVLASGATAQDPPPGPSCALVSTDEVNAVFSGADLRLDDHSRGWYCSFEGGFTLTMSVMTDTDLATTKADFGGGGEDVTVSGRPAWWQESSGNLAVEADGAVLFMNGWDSAETSEGQFALLAALAGVAVGRIPPPPDPDVVARLRALVRTAAADPDLEVPVVPGWYLVGMADAVTPEMQALLDLLATQGRSASDLVLVAGSSAVDASMIVAEATGFDGATLLLPLLYAASPTAVGAPVTSVEIAGKQVTRVETQPTPTYAIASGPTAVYATGPDAFLGTLFGALP